MAVEAVGMPPDPSADPEYQMGVDLMAYKRRQQFMHTIRLAVVWLCLVLVLGAALLLLNFDPTYIRQNFTFILQGAWYTILISLVSITFATILALLGALGRLSKNSIAQGISSFYIAVFRGTPLLVQIYLIYSGLPQLGQQLKALGMTQIGDAFILTSIQSGILALSLNYGAYMTEIFRAGIQSIAYGQGEAASAIGMSRWQTMRRVILPQAVRIIIPDIGNQFIAMQKDSSLISVIGVWEITFRANRLGRQESKFLEMYLLGASIYFLLTIVSTWLLGIIEKRLSRAYER